jgi:uncharacterized membrane protein
MRDNRIVVYDTIKIGSPKPTDPRLWTGLILLGGLLLIQTWASLEFQAVMKAPYANLPYTILISALFGLTWLVEIAAVLAIVFLVVAAVVLTGRAVGRLLSRIYRVVFRR